MVRKLAFAVVLIVLVAMSLPLAAQESESGALAEALNNPRGLTYGADGTLYITEAGTTGEETVEGEFGPVNYGPTARVLAVPAEGGEAQVVADGLVSFAAFDNVVGVNNVHVTEDGTQWIVLGGPFAGADLPATGVLILDAEGNQVGFVDIGAYEVENNPDGDIPASNPHDIAVAPDGTVYLTDASGNALYTITAEGEINLVHVWEDLPVPTGVAVGPDGSVYVGFLTAFPFPAGGSRVERWSPEGELVETYEGLSYVTDVEVGPDGTVYAVEFATSFGDFGFEQNTGRVVSVSADGITPIAEGLNLPYGLAVSPDGALAVTVNSAFGEPGSGMVIVPGMNGGAGDDVSTANIPLDDPAQPEAPLLNEAPEDMSGNAGDDVDTSNIPLDDPQSPVATEESGS